VTQCARILAARRALDPTVAAMGAVLHDIFVIVTGSYEDHARRGGPIAQEMLTRVGQDDAMVRQAILAMVTEHSDKHIFTSDSYTELGKDVDVLDCLLYPGALDEYLLTKPFDRVAQYLKRAQGVWDELGLITPRSFSVLDEYEDDAWLTAVTEVSETDVRRLTALCSDGALDFPIVIARGERGYFAATTQSGSDSVRELLRNKPADGSDMIPDGHARLLWPHLNRFQDLEASAVARLGIPSLVAR
jgi:hypothetical protein